MLWLRNLPSLFGGISINVRMMADTGSTTTGKRHSIPLEYASRFEKIQVFYANCRPTVGHYILPTRGKCGFLMCPILGVRLLYHPDFFSDHTILCMCQNLIPQVREFG